MSYALHFHTLRPVPDDPKDASPAQLPVSLQQPSFYVSDFVRRDNPPKFTAAVGSMFIGANNRTACDQLGQLDDYRATVTSGYTVDTFLPTVVTQGDIDNGIQWGPFYSNMDAFTMRGQPSGKICGLDQTFTFTNMGNGQFCKSPVIYHRIVADNLTPAAFTDGGSSGICQNLYQGDPSTYPRPATNCNGPEGIIDFFTLPSLACWVPGVDNYCRDYGSM
jgi:hypothetical protein